jgi:hypothetical protein
MFGDAERPTRVRAEQERALRTYVRRQVYPYSVFNRNRLSAAGLGPYGVREIADLQRVTPVTWTEVGDGTDLMLRPNKTTITRLGSPSLAFRVLFARLLGRRQELNQSIIEPIYRPIHWLVQEGVPVGVTANDLERLSELGRRWLEAAGVSRNDLVVSILPSGAHLDYWQLAAATRRAGVAAVFLDNPPALDELVRTRPHVLAGRPDDVLALAERVAAAGSPALSSVHTVLATGALMDDDTRGSIRRLFGADVAVLSAWAPPGVRALWAECRGGTGFHTWPAAEIVEVVHPDTLEPVAPDVAGEVVWSALGWAGTVALRLRTGVRAVLDEQTCPTCARTTPRVVPVAADRWAEAVVASPPRVVAAEPELVDAGARTQAAPVTDFAPPVNAAPAAPAAEFVFAPAASENGDAAGVFLVPILDGHAGVAEWQGELSRRDGTDELVVFLATSRPGHPGRLVRELDERLSAVQPATQFVVLSLAKLEARLAEHDHERVIDRR